MAIGGTGLTTTNSYFRMFIIAFAGIMVFGVLISWRSQVLFNAEYVEFPKHKPAPLADDMNKDSRYSAQRTETKNTLTK